MLMPGKFPVRRFFFEASGGQQLTDFSHIHNGGFTLGALGW